MSPEVVPKILLRRWEVSVIQIYYQYLHTKSNNDLYIDVLEPMGGPPGDRDRVLSLRRGAEQRTEPADVPNVLL